MKFLANFDTSVDTKSLQEAQEEADTNNILLIKKHPVFLIQGIVRYVSLIFLTAIFAWIILQVDKENNAFEYIMIIAVIVVMLYWMTLVAWRYYKYSFFFHTSINAPLEIGTIHTKKFDAFILHSLIVGISYILCFIIFEIEKALRGYEN